MKQPGYTVCAQVIYVLRWDNNACWNVRPSGWWRPLGGGHREVVGHRETVSIAQDLTHIQRPLVLLPSALPLDHDHWLYSPCLTPRPWPQVLLPSALPLDYDPWLCSPMPYPETVTNGSDTGYVAQYPTPRPRHQCSVAQRLTPRPRHQCSVAQRLTPDHDTSALLPSALPPTTTPVLCCTAPYPRPRHWCSVAQRLTPRPRH